MIFTHDTEVALANAVALVNSDPARSGGVEHLPDVAALDAHFTEWGWTGRHDGTEAELAEVRAMRPRFAELWELEEDDVAERVNALLSEAQAPPSVSCRPQVSATMVSIGRRSLLISTEPVVR